MPNVGEKAPEFTLPNQDGQPVKLSDFRGQKVILFAFPKAGTPGCNNQACNFRDEFPRIETANAVVLGISSDPVDALKQWQQTKKLPYDLLSDADHTVLDQWDAWGSKVLGFIPMPMAQRSYWVMDENGVVIDMQVGVGPEESVKKALAAVEKSTRQTEV